jgi:hypothetical protein
MEDRILQAAHQPARPRADLRPIDAAVLAALAYSDVFDWPLTSAEIHRSLSMLATAGDVEDAVASMVSRADVSRVSDQFVLFGRHEIIECRRRREHMAVALWPRALRYGRLIAHLPFVSMVAVSGSLAVNAADTGADVDLFVVTEDGRLWTARAMIIGLVRAARIGRDRDAPLCPNYLISESNLALRERDMFTARELAQLVPLSGGATYERLLAENDWYREFLPNHPGSGPARLGSPSTIGRRLRPLLRPIVVDRVERWEMDRKVAALTAGPTIADARFDSRECKGHVDGHRQRILAEYAARLDRLGVDA